MRVVVASVLLAAACGGPGQTELAQTPTATTPRIEAVAPPASVDDDERYWVTDSLEDVRDTQQAWREANRAPRPVPPPQALAPAPATGAQPRSTPDAPDRR
jgi:hypothetical protein